MKKFFTIFMIVFIGVLCSFSLKDEDYAGQYISDYSHKLKAFEGNQQALFNFIQKTDITSPGGIQKIREQIAATRIQLKGVDFWLRYIEPIIYKQINGPLPVEWETEVFEKFEKPYKREGAGLTLAELYLEEEKIRKDTLLKLVQRSIDASQAYFADSITKELQTHHHFFLANRLFLLNLAAIYTTGFECPDTSRVIPELRSMLQDVTAIYTSFNDNFRNTPLSSVYLDLYKNCIGFANQQPSSYSGFDHFVFIRDYINPLFKINQQLIKQYKVYTKSFVDYSLNNNSTSIFSKDLYFGQSSKGIFLRVTDKEALQEIERIGKLLFYDPILSGNNKRSCNSCHKSTEYFTDTSLATSFGYDNQSFLPRNSPSLINATYNHLLMLDGKHISMQAQARAVMTNAAEMGSNEKDLLQKVLNCNEYRNAFKSFLKYTPQEPEITVEHLASALTMYYSKFSSTSAAFDEAMNKKQELEAGIKEGFNLFMSKAQCGTCHFVPQFNGVKPPYVGSEFEVLGVPADTGYKKLSADKGRFEINPVAETANAFRTGSIRNILYTKPYMHNGVFSTLEQVIDFYDGGGGAGRGLKINNQTLSADSLKLTALEKKKLILFMTSLSENINFEAAPQKLPASRDKALNARLVGGEY